MIDSTTKVCPMCKSYFKPIYTYQDCCCRRCADQYKTYCQNMKWGAVKTLTTDEELAKRRLKRSRMHKSGWRDLWGKK